MSDDALSVNGQCQVTISDDEMNAWITLTSPQNGGVPVTLERVKEALENSGVTTNINNLAVEEAVFLMLWDTPHLIANGIPPEEGRDGYIQYYFPMSEELLKPLESEDGKVDFHNLNLIHNVKKGELLAEKFPCIEGKDGWTVRGKVLHPKPVKNFPLVGGKDTVLEPPGMRLFAARDGHVVCIDDKPTVLSVYVVQHHLDFSVGNIDFVGNVQVQGDVKTGFSIKAGGDIEVQGMVEAADLDAGGNVLVKNGIFGAGHCTIIAEGNVMAKYIENSVIKAGKDVLVNDSISRSQVKSGGKIKVNSPEGDIVGGHLEALDEISASYFGSELHIPTTLELGLEPTYRKEYLELLGKYKEKTKAFQMLQGFIIEYKNYREQKKAISDSYRRVTRERLQQYEQYRRELSDIEEKISTFENEFERLNRGIVKATRMVYPGVTVTIVKNNYVVEEELKRIMFIYDKGEITPVPIRG